MDKVLLNSVRVKITSNLLQRLCGDLKSLLKTARFGGEAASAWWIGSI